MDVPINSFKRAINSGRSADRAMVQPRQQHLGRDRGRIGLRLAAARHRALAQRGADGLQPAPGCDGEPRPPDRPPALERSGDDQAVPRRRGADAADPDDPDPGGGGAGRGLDPLSAARRARLRLGVALVALRPGQGLSYPLRGGDLRAGADRDQAGSGQSGGHRRGGRGRRRVHRPGRPLGRPGLSGRPGQSGDGRGLRGRDRAGSGPSARRPAS